MNALWLVHNVLSGQKITPHQLTQQSSEGGDIDDDYDDGAILGPSPDQSATDGEDQSSPGARSKHQHPMDGALLTPKRQRTRDGFGGPFLNRTPSRDGLRKDQGKIKKMKKVQHYFVYPKSCGFSWNCHGQLVFFSNQKYNFDALKKDQRLKRFQDWPAHKDRLTSREQDVRNRAQASDYEPKNQMIDVMDRDDGQSEQSESSEDDDQGDERYTYYGDEGDESETEYTDPYTSTPTVAYRDLKRAKGPSLFQGDFSSQQSPGKALPQSKRGVPSSTKHADDDAEHFFPRRSESSLFLHSLQHLFRPSLRIARSHTLYDEQVKLLCNENSLKFSQSKEPHLQELAKYWQMISVALGDMNASKMQIWSKHPLGKGIIFKVLKHFESIGDIQ